MLSRFLVCGFAICLAAMGQPQTTMTIEQLKSFLKSSQEFIAKKQMTDAGVASYLAHTKLTERLDDRTIEDLQSYSIGPKTLQALNNLKSKTQELAEAAIVLPPKPKPPPTSEEQGDILHETRQYVMSYDKGLPNYICTETERRKVAPRPGGKYGAHSGGEIRWQTSDELVSKLSYYERKEEKKLILQNNRPATLDYKHLGGSTSNGDFGSLLRGVFDLSSEARFEWDHWGTLRGRLSMVFNYHVSQNRSQWHIQVKDANLDLIPAYHGLVYIDNQTRNVMRVTLEAEEIPPDFPVKRASEILDYDYVDISGHTYLLPLLGEVELDGIDVLTMNKLEFANYSKYSAESEIKYTEIPPEMSQSKEGEAKPTIDCKDPKNQNLKECKK